MTNRFALDRRNALMGLGLAAAAAIPATALAQAQPAGKPLAGKVAIVTGARNNMGRAFSVALAERGADVVVHYHRAETRAEAERTASLVREAGARAALVQGDLGRMENALALFATAQRAFGGADIVVNNAGAIVKTPLAQLTDEELERMINANTRLNYNTVRAAARHLREDGRLISIGSSLFAGVTPNYSAYAGTKAVVEEITRAAVRELGPRRITANVVAPGPIDTPFFHSAETPESTRFASNLAPAGRLGRAEEIAGVVAFLATPEAGWINGQTIFVNGGYLTR